MAVRPSVRSSIRPEARIQGVITEGGAAPNVTLLTLNLDAARAELMEVVRGSRAARRRRRRSSKRSVRRCDRRNCLLESRII